MSHNNIFTTFWRFAQPFIYGKGNSYKKWVSNHYDVENLQLYFLDSDYHTYTPGVFENSDETLEEATKRKLDLAFDGLDLKAGDRVLDVGAGWGSFLGYAARKGVHVTGITLSKHQLGFINEMIRKENLDAEIIYQDFFTYEPKKKYDGIVINGVLEELSDYPEVVKRIAKWVKPDRKVYLDFYAAIERFTISAFITRYMYQGTSRRVYLPEWVEAVTKSPFELVSLYNDRQNYYLTTRAWIERFEERREEIKARWGERIVRMYSLYLSSANYIVGEETHFTTAYRMFLHLPPDYRQVV